MPWASDVMTRVEEMNDAVGREGPTMWQAGENFPMYDVFPEDLSMLIRACNDLSDLGYRNLQTVEHKAFMVSQGRPKVDKPTNFDEIKALVGPLLLSDMRCQAMRDREHEQAPEPELEPEQAPEQVAEQVAPPEPEQDRMDLDDEIGEEPGVQALVVGPPSEMVPVATHEPMRIASVVNIEELGLDDADYTSHERPRNIPEPYDVDWTLGEVDLSEHAVRVSSEWLYNKYARR